MTVTLKNGFGVLMLAGGLVLPMTGPMAADPLADPTPPAPQTSEDPASEVPAPKVPAPGASPTADGPRCVSMRRVRSTQIIDAQSILLRMSGRGPDYVMRLKYRCSGLTFHESFYYELTGGGELCAKFDWITTRSGSACSIDRFDEAERGADKDSLKIDAPEKGGDVSED